MLGALLPLLAPPAHAQDTNAIGVCGYRALLFGVEAYDDPDLADLDTPHEDVNAIAETLRDRYGVEVEVVLDPDRRGILDAIDALRSRAEECEAVIVYFAGHGIQDDAADEGYWLPKDADDESRATWISNADVAAGVNAMSARHVLLVSDSCFSGSLFNTRGLNRVEPRIDDATLEATRLARDRSRWVVTSGGNEPVADQYREGLSVFAYFLRQQLTRVEHRYVSVDKLFPGVRSLVVTNASQTPQQGPFMGTGHEGGQLVLINREATTETFAEGPVLVPPVDAGKARGVSGPTAPDWWVPGIVIALSVFGVGGLVWLWSRRRRTEPASPEFQSFKQQTYQGLWNRVEKLHGDLRRGEIPPEAYVQRVGEVNAFVLERGVHIDPDDADLVDRYLKALIRLKQATDAAGDAAQADLETTGAFHVQTLQQSPELANLDQEVRRLREQLREKVRSQYS
ncbi:MAG: caspase family protein [Myxococcota bacterium]